MDKWRQMKSQLQEKVFKKQQKLNDMVKRRKQMQEKLRQIYMKQQEESKQRRYREKNSSETSMFSQSFKTNPSTSNSSFSVNMLNVILIYYFSTEFKLLKFSFKSRIPLEMIFSKYQLHMGGKLICN